MNTAMDYAKFFLKQEEPSIANTIDGNMKLQKLLSFADMISFAKYGKPLFKDDVLAFENGYVVESVRQRYLHDYDGFKVDSERFNPNFTAEEYKVLNDTLGIFGKLPAKELSKLSHEFLSWKKAFENGTRNDFHYKENSKVDFSLAEDDIARIKSALDAYENERNTPYRKEVINGSTFYIPFDCVSDDLMEKLEEFSKDCPEDSYTVAYDDGTLVVY